MACSKALRASLTETDYDYALEDVKDQYYKPYIHAASNSTGCRYMTLPSLPPLLSYMFPPRPISTYASLFTTSLPSCHAPPSPVSRSHPPPSGPPLPSTSLPILPPQRPFAPRPSSSQHPFTCLPRPASLHLPSPSYWLPTILSLLASLPSSLFAYVSQDPV